jgi:hypothetical protein
LKRSACADLHRLIQNGLEFDEKLLQDAMSGLAFLPAVVENLLELGSAKSDR